MAFDPAADMHVFFDADEFGEAITVDGVSGIVGIWDRPTGTIEVQGRQAIVDTNVMHIPVSSVADPYGMLVRVERTGQLFQITGEPMQNRDGTIWACQLEPA